MLNKLASDNTLAQGLKDIANAIRGGRTHPVRIQD